MKFQETELPSNRSFGFFFSAVFFVSSTLFFVLELAITAFVIFIIAIVLLVITILRADLLLPLNKLWMLIGFLLGMIISPIIMAFIFFALITPYGIALKIMGRDELRLKKDTSESYWINRASSKYQTNYKRQF